MAAISQLKRSLQIRKFESVEDYAKAYDALLVIAATYGPESQSTLDTIKLMLSILKEARTAHKEFQTAEFVERLRETWSVIQEVLFGGMTDDEKNKVFAKIKKALEARKLPFRIMEIDK